LRIVPTPTDLTKDLKEFQEALGISWARRFKGTSVVLMVLGAIEGFTNSKPVGSMPAKKSQSLLEPQYSSVVNDGAVSMSAKDSMAAMKLKDDLGHEESRDFSGLDVVDGA
jgi:hypothetical protein